MKNVEDNHLTLINIWLMFSMGSRGGGKSEVAPPFDSVKGYLFAHKHEMEDIKRIGFFDKVFFC